MENCQVVAVKCPILNYEFRAECLNSSPSIEVLFRVHNAELIDIICPKYDSGCRAKGSKGNCIYSKGWKTLE